VLANGLIARTFRLRPNAATVSFRRLANHAEFVRSVRPEAEVAVNGVGVSVGGLVGQPVHNYLDEAWLEALEAAPGGLTLAGFAIGAPEASVPWAPRYGAPDSPWPPKGLRLTLRFEGTASPEAQAARAEALRVNVNYELYDGLPVLAKWLVIENIGGDPVEITGLTTELLAVPRDQASRIWAESDMAFNQWNTTRWLADPLYETHAPDNYRIRMIGDRLLYTPPAALDPWREYEEAYNSGGGVSQTVLASLYPVGPGKVLSPGESFRSFTTYEILHDSDDLERKGLARRRMYRTLTPWTQENPIFMHLRHSDSESIRGAVDQCVDVGFEMIILTFGSGFDMLSTDRAYRDRIKADFDYAHSRGIGTGGYILFCSTAAKGADHDAVQDVYPASLCLGSAYVDGYFERLFDFMEREGLLVPNTDNQMAGPRGYGYVSDLPGPDAAGTTTLKQLWGWAESQETTGLSPGMFKDFVLPYLARLSERFGLIYYGCCEPVHDRLELIMEAIPNLRSVSVSGWADFAKIGELLGKRYVYSRKPTPALLSGADPEWALAEEDMRKTRAATRNGNVEILLRDLYTVNGERSRLRKWVEMTRAIFQM